MITKFCENLILKLKESQAVYLRTISSGVFEKFEDYKLCAGRLKGLEESESIVREMYRNIFESQKPNSGGRDNVEESEGLY